MTEKEKFFEKLTDPVRICNAITEALREMEKCPNDSVQDIWNESLESWKTGLRMNNSYIIEAING